MIILGIDPGTTRLGWAVLKTSKKTSKSMDFGCFMTKKEKREERLADIYKKLNQLIRQHQPQILALEKIFFFKNAKTVMSISEAIGVILLSCKKNNLNFIELSPLEIKQSLIGYGRAEKRDVQKIVQCLLGLKTAPKLDDTTDAIAVALAGINKLKMKNEKLKCK